MAGMGEICNHVATAMYHVEAAVRMGLTGLCKWFDQPLQAMSISGCQIEKLLNRKRLKIWISVEKILGREQKKRDH